MRKIMRLLDKLIINDIKLPLFLIKKEKWYRYSLGIISSTTIATMYSLLQFDFSNLIEAGMLSLGTKIVLIKLAPKIVVMAGLSALLILHHVFVKKWLLNPRRLSYKDLKTIGEDYFEKS